MKIRIGWDFHGHLAQPDGTSNATLFLNVMYVPLIPWGGYLMTANRAHAAPSSLSLRSVLAAYFKSWGLILSGLMIVYGAIMGDGWSRAPQNGVITAAGVLLLCVTMASWLFWGVRKGQRPIVAAVIFLIAGLATAAVGTVDNLERIERRRGL